MARKRAGRGRGGLPMSLAARLITAMVIVVTSTAVAVGLVTYRQFESLVVPGELEQIQERSQLLRDRLTYPVREATTQVITLTGSAALEGVVRAESSGGIDPLDGTAEEVWRERLGRLMMRALEAQPSHVQLRLIGRAGRELVRAERTSTGEVRIVPAPELQEKSDRPYVDATLALAEGETYVSPIELNQERGSYSLPHQPVLRVGTPVYARSGEVFGLLIANVDMGIVLSSIASSMLPGSTLYVGRESGDYLLHPDPSMAFGAELGRPARWRQDFPEIAEELSRGSESAALFADRREEPVAVAGSRISLAERGPEMVLLQVIPSSAVLAAFTSVRGSVLLVGGIALAGAVGLSLLLGWSLTRPITQLAAAVEDFRGTAPIGSIPMSRLAGNEVRALSESVQRMSREVVDNAAELRARAHEHLLAAVVEYAGDPVVGVDPQGIVTTWNPAAERMYGLASSEVIHRPIERSALDREGRLGELIEQARARTLENVELQGERAGRRVDAIATIAPIRNAEDEVIGFSITLRNISELRRAERRFRLVVESAPSGMLVCDAEGRIRMVNEECERLLGYSRTELLELSVEALVPEGMRGRHPELRASYLEKPTGPLMGKGRPVFAIRKNGSAFPVEIALRPFEAENGESWALATILDVTERKENEARMQQYAAQLEQSNEQLEQFAYVVSHDLKAPLRGISSVATWLAEDFKSVADPRSLENIDLMLERTRRLDGLIDGILEYSRVGRQAMNRRWVDTDALAFDVIESLEAPSSVRLRVEGTLPELYFDETQLRQVFQNLLQNAIRHMGRSDGVVVVSCDRQGSEWCFHVRDNGVGIPEAHREQIFGLFQTLRSKDVVKTSGVGLTILKRIIERNGGRVRVGTSPEGGADFVFTVPYRSRAAQAREEATDGP